MIRINQAERVEKEIWEKKNNARRCQDKKNQAFRE